MSHYSAIGDTISCDAPDSAIGFGGKPFLGYPLVRSVFGLRLAIFKGSRGGVAAIVCDTTGNTVRQGLLLHLSRDSGGHFGRVTKFTAISSTNPQKTLVFS